MKTFSEKKVAAVLFTDIEGYSLVSNQNQQRGLEMARIHREVIQFCVAIYGGECINFYGDGSLSLFSEAKDAVSCAIQMQHRFRMEGGIPVRIGIHAGEVVCDAGSAYGDAVNIASRIQNIAPKGGILVSGEVYQSTRSQKLFRMVAIGSEKLKNIHKPVDLYYVDHPNVSTPEKGEVHRRAVAKAEVNPNVRPVYASLFTLFIAILAVMAAFYFDMKQLSTPPNVYEAKLAVMSFDNRTGHPEDSVFGDIAAEQIIQVLRRLPGTDVVSSTSMNTFEAVREAGFYEMWKVPGKTQPRNLILGKYFREGDSIVIVAELIDLMTRKYIHTWTPQKAHYLEPMKALTRLKKEMIFYWVDREPHPMGIQNFEALEYHIEAPAIRQKNEDHSLGYPGKGTLPDPNIPGARSSGIAGRRASIKEGESPSENKWTFLKLIPAGLNEGVKPGIRACGAVENNILSSPQNENAQQLDSTFPFPAIFPCHQQCQSKSFTAPTMSTNPDTEQKARNMYLFWPGPRRSGHTSMYSVTKKDAGISKPTRICT